MSLAILIVRLGLALTFVIAGLAKLADGPGTRRAFADFGVPDILVRPFGILLPLAELGVAVALVPTVSVWWAAIGALALLVLFSGAVGLTLARGRKPQCHCFGQLHSTPIGWPTLARNAALAAGAGFVVWQGRTNPGLSAVSWTSSLTTAQVVDLIVAAAVVIALAGITWVLVQVLRQQGRLLLRLDALEQHLAVDDALAHMAPPAAVPPPAAGLPVGAPAPTFALAGLYGETLTLDALRAPGKPVLLVFSDPGCGPCAALMPDIGRWQREQAAALTVAMVSRGTPEANRAKSTEHGVTSILLQQDREVAQEYQANGTPGAVLVQPDGTIGSPLALGTDAIRALVARTVGGPIPLPVAPAAALGGSQNGHAAPPPAPPALKFSDPAPALTLPDLSGKMVNLSDFRGRNTLVLFWNPGCGFCQQMLDDLKTWETSRPKGAPGLLVVSTGTIEANHAMGLRSPVLLDQNFIAGRAFAAHGTPMAVLVDAKGRIASEVAAGGPAVLALAREGHVQAQVGTGGR